MNYTDVLDFWFGDLDEHGVADEAHAARWWRKDPDFDAEIRDRFGATYEAIRDGGHLDWLERPRGRLAYVIVLDQFSRNMFRDDPRMYALDTRAQQVALDGVAAEHHLALTCGEQVFLYMPLMHAEDLAAQDRCVQLFEALHAKAPAEAKETMAGNLKFGHMHRDIVVRFGRFPHRNNILGRATTEGEAEFLQQPGSSF